MKTKCTSIMKEKSSPKSKVSFVSMQDDKLIRPTDITNQIPDVSLFTKVTNWTPKISLDESIEWLLDECRKEVANDSSR